MKRTKKFIPVMLTLILCCSLVFPASAIVNGKQTNYYGYLSGEARQNGVYLQTSANVTSNNYGGTLHLYGDISDGYNTYISSYHYQSNAGALSKSASVYMTSIQKAVAKPGFAATTEEIRGGTKTGDYVFVNININSSYF